MKNSEDHIRKIALKRIKQKKGFYGHLSAFLGVGFFFFIINYMTNLNGRGPGDWWFFYPLAPWSIGLIIHYLTTFGIPGTETAVDGWEEKALEKEMNRLRKIQASLPMSTTPQNKDEERLELEDLPKEQEKEKEKMNRWDEDDLI